MGIGASNLSWGLFSVVKPSRVTPKFSALLLRKLKSKIYIITYSFIIQAMMNKGASTGGFAQKNSPFFRMNFFEIKNLVHCSIKLDHKMSCEASQIQVKQAHRAYSFSVPSVIPFEAPDTASRHRKSNSSSSSFSAS